MTISIEKERLTARTREGTLMGQIAFPRVRAGLVNISSVEISPGFRGQGVEEAMMLALVNHLEKSGQKAALTAPCAQQFFETNPQWSHVLPGRIHFTTH